MLYEMENKLLNSRHMQQKLEGLVQETGANPEVVHTICVSCILSGIHDWEILENTVLQLLTVNSPETGKLTAG